MNKAMKMRILIILTVLFSACVGGLKDEDKRKPIGTPEQAKWLGGADGGVWVNIKEHLENERYLIAVYTDGGILWVQDIYQVEQECIETLKQSNQKLFSLMNSFDGINFLLEIQNPMTNKYCYLKASNQSDDWPKGVPAEAKWIRGITNGYWITIGKQANDSVLDISLYLKDGTFKSTGMYQLPKAIPDTVNIIDYVYDYQGANIVLKIGTENYELNNL